MPYGMTHADMFAAGGTANITKWDFGKMAERLSNDERCLGPGLAAYFVQGALARGVTLLTGTRAAELIAAGERVVGVRAERTGRAIDSRARKAAIVPGNT